MYSTLVILVVIALLSNALAFSPMKSNMISRRSSLSMSMMTNVPVDVLSAKAQLIATTMATAETADIADPITALGGFVFIALAIMGSLGSFLGSFAPYDGKK